MYASGLKNFLKEFHSNLKMLKHLFECEFIYEHATTFIYKCDSNDLTVSYDVEHDDDCFLINIYFVIDGFPDKFNIKDFYFDPRDGLLCITYRDGTEFQMKNYNTDITEEFIFQQSLLHDLKNTDVQYWKDCAKLMNRIGKVEL